MQRRRLPERRGRRGLVVANLGRDEDTVRVDGGAVFRRVFASGSAPDACEPGRSLRLGAGDAWVGVS